ncbi:unnamed protein product [Larinioides sclopetarius]|uniref:Uncharacterized protein n=1 Tax=Larinioides sclopetarius TaxID=280406 RepID=A0AAV1YST1_9ARAC
MTSFSNNTPANGFVNTVDSDDFFHPDLKNTDYAYTHQYMPQYPRYHQAYSTSRFDVPCNLTPPQPDRTSPYDFTYCGGTPRYGHIANAPLVQYPYDVSHCNQNFYQHSNVMPCRPDLNSSSTFVETSDFDSNKINSPPFTPPNNSQYENVPASIVPPTPPESNASSTGVSTSPVVDQKTVPNATESVFPWMKTNSRCFFRYKAQPADLHTFPNSRVREGVPFQSVFDQTTENRDSSYFGPHRATNKDLVPKQTHESKKGK